MVDGWQFAANLLEEEPEDEGQEPPHDGQGDVDRGALLKVATDAGFAFLPGQAFHVANADVPYLRLAFGHLSEQQISDGIPVLARCLRAARRSNEPRSFDSLFAE